MGSSKGSANGAEAGEKETAEAHVDGDRDGPRMEAENGQAESSFIAPINLHSYCIGDCVCL